MGKIKGWTKKKGKDADIWIGRTQYRSVIVHKSYDSLGQWVVGVNGMTQSGEVNHMGMNHRRYYDTKEDAMYYAVSFMRRHPDG